MPTLESAVKLQLQTSSVSNHIIQSGTLQQTAPIVENKKCLIENHLPSQVTEKN